MTLLFQKAGQSGLEICPGREVSTSFGYGDTWTKVEPNADKNAISVLKAIVQNFPAVNWIGRDMHTAVNNLSQNDERDDVKIPAASLIGDLNRRKKKWMLPQAFMISNQPIPKGSQTDKTGKGTGSRPQSTTPTPFNATAPEFKPGPAE